MPSQLSSPSPQNRPSLSNESGVLTIELAALQANYKAVRDLAASARCAAVVKADAYGTGIHKVAPALYLAGCRTFFVATLAESCTLRSLLPDAEIYCLNGLLPNTAETFAHHDIRPVLGGLDEIREWNRFEEQQHRPLPAALHFDTGMNRLGLTPAETEIFLSDSKLRQTFQPSLIMSHLACADTPSHPLNARQLAAFKQIVRHFPGVPASLANSAGLLLGPAYHFDLVRPGIFLYGSWPLEKKAGRPPFSKDIRQHNVATLQARILKVKEVSAHQTVGYGAAAQLETPARIATLSLGYADGFLRSCGMNGPTSVWLDGHKCPLVGRVSMDLVTIDVSKLPPSTVKRGTLVEIIGPHNNIDDMAAAAGTIGYELLTSLGNRYARHYTKPCAS